MRPAARALWGDTPHAPRSWRRGSRGDTPRPPGRGTPPARPESTKEWRDSLLLRRQGILPAPPEWTKEWGDTLMLLRQGILPAPAEWTKEWRGAHGPPAGDTPCIPGVDEGVEGRPRPPAGG